MIFVSYVKSYKDYNYFDNVIIDEHIESGIDILRIEEILDSKFSI